MGLAFRRARPHPNPSPCAQGEGLFPWNGPENGNVATTGPRPYLPLRACARGEGLG
jgi:hypothetical protein